MKKLKNKMKKQVVKNYKQNRGITLVALVITIIVLIILAAVSINAVMNGGLIQNAKDASKKWEGAQGKEQLELAKIEGMLTAETLKEVKAGEYTGTENKKYVQGGKTAIIPAGFTVSNIDSEKTIAGGLVIYAGDHSTVTDMTTVQGTANQYVWIPVDNPSDIYGTLESEVEGIEGFKFGKLYDFGNSTDGFATSASQATHLNWPTETGYSKTGYREPAYLNNNSGDNSSSNIDADGSKVITEDGLKKLFTDMITSVEKYKGFYIGRYELTGSVTKPSIVKGKNPLNQYTSYSVTTYLGYFGLYTMCEQLEADNDKVRTSMIWGCQWDQAIKMSLTDKTDFLTNAADYGVYGTSKKVSGTMLSAYNIYDMAGNFDDNTLEARVAYNRVCRGSDFGSGISEYNYPSYREGNSYLKAGMQNYGARAQLFIR